jgi:type I pantothenate kinase
MRLQSLNDPISIEEVAVHPPPSRLLLYAVATQGSFKATQRFLPAEADGKVPYIIGVAGSVAVGKSTTARPRCALARWPNTPKAFDLATTDGFLLPNDEPPGWG